MVSYQALFQTDRKAGGFVIMAEDLLATIIGDHIKQGEAIPVATKRRGARWRQISLPALQSAKVELYQAFISSGMRKAELERRVGIPKSNLDRLFDLRHHSRLDQLEAAFIALNKRIWFEVRDAA